MSNVDQGGDSPDILDEIRRRAAGYSLAADADIHALINRIRYLEARQESHLATIRSLSQSVPLDSEISEALNQRGALLAEIGTLKAAADSGARARRACEAEVATLTASHPKCSLCGNPAECLGSYEGDDSHHYSCDDHCSHDCDDGECFRLADLPAEFSKRAEWADIRDRREARNLEEIERMRLVVDAAVQFVTRNDSTEHIHDLIRAVNAYCEVHP